MSSTNVRRLFERQAMLVSQGKIGREVYSALAADIDAPPHFTEKEASEILGLSPAAIAKRRARKMAPSYLSTSSRHVIYPRADLCLFMASMYVDRRSA